MPYLISLLLILVGLTKIVFALPPPVIFVHGIADSSVAWKVTGPAVSSYYDKYYKTEEHPYFYSGSGIGLDAYDQDFSDNLRNNCIYVTFKNHWASPADQVQELAKVIADTKEEVKKYFGEEVKVNLVAFSMGGLVARQYLTEHPKDHQVDKLVLISTPNLGTKGFLLNFVIPAMAAMQEGSEFLKELNHHPMTEDIEYTAIISNTTFIPHRIISWFLHEGAGDGAMSVKSQKLSAEAVPNFEKLNYREIYIDSPHFQTPFNCAPEVIQALDMIQYK